LKKKVSNDIFCVSRTNVRHSCGVYPYFKNKIQVLLLYIKTLCEAMVIDFLMFTSRPSTTQWSLISLCFHQDPLQSNGHVFFIIEALYEAMVIDLFTLKPSTRQWSSISLHQDPLQGNGHGFSHHWGPLRGNGHRSLYIKTLCEAMVIDFLCHIEALYEAMVINLFTSRPSTR